MDTATQRELVERMLSHRECRTTDLAASTRLIPVDAYRDPGRYQNELDAIFATCPLVVAHETQLPKVGSFVTDDVLGVPIVLVRKRDGEIGAFLNACRHRGTRLVAGGCGQSATGFVCPAHGWSYDLDGALRKVPDGARSFPEVERHRRGLLEIPTELRHGFVWIWLRPPADTGGVVAFLETLDAEFASYRFESYVHYRSERLIGRFNWKIGIEAFLETYHFRFLHPELRTYSLAPDTSLVDGYGAHVRLVAPKRSVDENLELLPEERRIRPHATIAYCVFPATLVFVEKHHVSLMQLRPVAVDACDVRIEHLVEEDTLRRRDYWDENIGKFMLAVAQDFASCESIQDGFGRPGSLAWPGHADVVFGRNEQGLQLFRDAVEAGLAH